MGRILPASCEAAISSSGRLPRVVAETRGASWRGLLISALRVTPKRSPICGRKSGGPRASAGIPRAFTPSASRPSKGDDVPRQLLHDVKERRKRKRNLDLDNLLEIEASTLAIPGTEGLNHTLCVVR